MNSANFHEYLKNPSMLHQVSYQELKSLMLQYPFSPNLRYLVLIKSLFENHKDHDRNLVLASLSSFDREKLRRLVGQYSKAKVFSENVYMEEEYLELMDLSMLEELPATANAPAREMALETPPSLEDIEPAGVHPSPAEERGSFDDFFAEGNDAAPPGEGAAGAEEAPGLLEDMLMEMPDDPATSAPQLVEELPETIEEEFSMEILLAAKGENLATLEDILDIPGGAQQEVAEMDDSEVEEGQLLTLDDFPSEPVFGEANMDETTVEDAQPAPAPAAPSGSWLKRVKPPQPGFLAKDLPPPTSLEDLPAAPNATPEPADKAKEVAAQSLLVDAEIATETLARILEKQGHYEKAIAMYGRLQLKFPKKSSSFAAKIEELKKLI